MINRLPKLLLTLFLLVVLTMVGWNLLHDALVPPNRAVPGKTVYTVLPPDYDVADSPVKYGRILGLYEGAIVFPDPSSARQYLRDADLESRRWRIYAMAGDYRDDTNQRGEYRYTKIAMPIEALVVY